MDYGSTAPYDLWLGFAAIGALSHPFCTLILTSLLDDLVGVQTRVRMWTLVAVSYCTTAGNKERTGGRFWSRTFRRFGAATPK